MRRWGLGVSILAAALLFVQAPAMPAEAADVQVPEDIFQWVQSTARQNYYFNKQQIKYAVDADGYIDLHTLIVPTLCTYDDVQVQDVVAKRRWKKLSMKGYDRLIGEANYLKFNLKAHTVQILEHDDLDNTFSTITKDTDYQPVQYDVLSEKDVDGKFYRAIERYANTHRDEILANTMTTGAKLRPADQKALAKAKK
ncbi:MAG: hypothetical protein SOV43_07600 [Selenomonadaceae bacterium]|nr:hypothetical protein [Selenomonadaceae bacterium]MDY2686023.1 hypothetical protein [Selenomonadaceae bacterium]